MNQQNEYFEKEAFRALIDSGTSEIAISFNGLYEIKYIF